MPAPLLHIETNYTLPAEADAVVIGAGIVGISAAFFLAERGLKVAVIEKGRVGAEQSSRNWGWCRQQNRDARELPMATKSLALWEHLTRETNQISAFAAAGCFISRTTQTKSRLGRAGAASHAISVSRVTRWIRRKPRDAVPPREKPGKAVSSRRMTASPIRKPQPPSSHRP